MSPTPQEIMEWLWKTYGGNPPPPSPELMAQAVEAINKLKS